MICVTLIVTIITLIMATKNNKKPSSNPQTTDSISIPMYVPNVLGYIRFVAILASWPFAMSDPKTFLALYVTSYALGAIDGPLAKILG